MRDGIPVTSVARTLVDLAGVLDSHALARAVDRAERLSLFDLRSARDTLARSGGRRGAAALRRAIDGWQPRRSASELEDRFRDLLEREAQVPMPRFNALVTGERRTHEVDALWEPARLAVELDGFAYHRTRRDLNRDGAREADLELAGYRVLRLTWDDVALTPRRTLRRLARLIADDHAVGRESVTVRHRDGPPHASDSGRPFP